MTHCLTRVFLQSLLWAHHGLRYLTCSLLSFPNAERVSLVLHVRRMRLREVKGGVQGHLALMTQPVYFTRKLMLLPPHQKQSEGGGRPNKGWVWVAFRQILVLPHICLPTPGACGCHVTWDEGLCRCDDEVQGLEMVRVFGIIQVGPTSSPVSSEVTEGGRRVKVSVRHSTIHRWVGGCRGLSIKECEP